MNIADIITKGEDPTKIGKFSEWQNGSDFMELPIVNWPINQDCSVPELPERNKIVLAMSNLNDNSLIDIYRFSKFNLLINVTARLLIKIKP